MKVPIYIRRATIAVIALAAGLFLSGLWTLAHSQSSSPAASNTDKSYLVEWVYRVKYGHQDEWWKIFQKYQIATLDKEKQLGYITAYTIYGPGLHTSEDSRWDYRVEITYRNQAAAGHGGEVEKQLFPDRDAARKEEDRRWELTENHWDLPIHVVDPHAAE